MEAEAELSLCGVMGNGDATTLTSIPGTSKAKGPILLPHCNGKRSSSKGKSKKVIQGNNPSATVRALPKSATVGALPKSKETEKEKEIDVLPDIEDFKPEEALSISRCLLDWYYVKQRVLPWRCNQNDGDEEEVDEEGRAYAVWVSEVMLQQTQVVTVVDYYNRWMEKWPTLRLLAQATQEEVNEMWAGLGYYRRARYLLEGAKEIVENQGGVFPRTLESLRKVRGIGNYTAGAIASIAFKQAVPVVDANVIRVICRLKAISANPKLVTTIKRLWELAGQLVDLKRPGDFNQALMELGATICSPTRPVCSSCPVAEHCNALANVRRYDSENKQQPTQNAVEGPTGPSVTDYPMKVLKAKPRKEFATVCVVEISPEYVTHNIHNMSSDRNLFLLVKRPEQGLLAGLWEFPSVFVSGSDLGLIQLKDTMDQYLENLLGIKISHKVMLRKSVGQYTHVFTHIRLHMYVEWMVLHMPDGLDELRKNENLNVAVLKWVDKKAIHSLGLTSGVRKVYRMIEEFKHGTGESKNKRQKKMEHFFH